MRVIKYKSIALFFVSLLFISNTFSKPIPFSLKRGVPEIEAFINDSIKATLIFDSGADQVYLDRAFADSNNLLFGTKLPVRPTMGIDQKVEAFQIFLKSLKVGSKNQKLVNTVIIDLHAIIKDTSQGIPDGVLGNSFLNNKQIYLNYVDSTLELVENDSLFAGQKAAVIPFIRNRHLITLNATINDSVDAKFILD
ncbi:MAG TPA: aspartyl protease family protein, partial [candidate division Zixibacteria bacterium]|nr:aspartyl protease family protein [candidate division Zixibacteria bacterium]